MAWKNIVLICAYGGLWRLFVNISATAIFFKNYQWIVGELDIFCVEFVGHLLCSFPCMCLITLTLIFLIHFQEKMWKRHVNYCCKSWDPTECVIQMTSEVTTNNSLIKYCWNIYCSHLWLAFIIIIGWFFGLSPTLEWTNLSFHLLENLWLVVFCVSLFFMSLNLSVAV
jgi:hypothetical protein